MRVTLLPTVKTLASGVPTARGLNLAASAGHSAHHGHAAGGPRTNFNLPKWASSISGTQTKSKIVGTSRAQTTPTRWAGKSLFPLGAMRDSRRSQHPTPALERRPEVACGGWTAVQRHQSRRPDERDRSGAAPTAAEWE